MQDIRISKQKIIRIVLFSLMFLCIFLPDGIKNAICIYKMTTKDINVLYTYNYYFTILDLFIIVIGLFFYWNSGIIRCIWVFLSVVFINIIRAILNQSNVISLGSYESLLMLIESISWVSIILSFFRGEKLMDELMSCFVVGVFALQIIQFLLGNLSEGRVGAISLGPGATAYIYTSFILWFLFSSRRINKSYIPLLFAGVGLILTGSRANILVLIALAICFFAIIYKNSKKTKTQKSLFFSGIIILVGVGFLFLTDFGFEFVSRITSFFSNDLITNLFGDSSYYGRVLSFNGGLAIWKDNPMGISCSIYDLEYRSSLLFGMEFPHSTLLSYILLWSPIIAIPVFFSIFRMLYVLFRQKDSSWVVLAVILFKYVFIGSPILYIPMYAIDILVFSYCNNRISYNKRFFATSAISRTQFEEGDSTRYATICN